MTTTMNPDLNKIEAALARRQPDMSKVNAAVAKYAPKRVVTVSSPERAKYPPQDAAIRKPLKAHGIKCPGFMCSHFHNLHS